MPTTCWVSWWWEQVVRASTAIPATTSQAAGDRLWPRESRGLGCWVRSGNVGVSAFLVPPPSPVPAGQDVQRADEFQSGQRGLRPGSFIPSVAAWL